MSIKTSVNPLGILLIVLLSEIFIIVSSETINSELFEGEGLNQKVENH